MNFDPRYLKGIELFNAGDFFDAHETWEELWHDTQGEPRNFLQGLIQAATALHHFQNRNLKGAKILFGSFGELVRTYPGTYMGVDLDGFRRDMTSCFGPLAPHSVESLPGRASPDRETFPVRLEESRTPKIRFAGPSHG